MKRKNLQQWHEMLVLATVLLCLPSLSFGFINFLPSKQVARLADSLIRRSYTDKGNIYEPKKPDNNGASEALPPPAGQLVQTKNLYDVLGASHDATRSELKQCYVRMAKACHPDAQVGKTEKGGAMTLANGQPLPEFSEVAAAWEVLGDSKLRRRYDRNLRAEQWSKTAQSFTNQQLETVVPAVSEILEKVAVPFLRRTTATTVAVGQAVAKGMSKKNDQERRVSRDSLTNTFVSAVEAGQQAGRAIDSMELTEKSLELEERAKREAERAVSVAQELANITEKRLFGTLQSSDFALSSEEALQVLEILGVEDEEMTMLDRAMRKSPIQEEIESLKKAEVDFSEKLSTYEATDSEWNDLLKQQEKSKQDLTVAKQAEIEARRVLIEMQQQVSQAKADLVSASDRLRSVEYVVKKNAYEMDRVTVNLSKKQEKVRAALRKKAEDKIKEDIAMTEDDLSSLRRREIQLMGESTQLERMVSRLQNKAESLRERAKSLDRWQSMRHSAENGNLESVGEAAQ